MRHSDHNDILELIPAYALGALDAEEESTVRQHLTTCAACRQELSAYQGVVDLLPLAAPVEAPTPALKSRLMARVQTTPTKDTAADGSWWRRLQSALRALATGPRWRPVAFVAILALLVSNLLLWQQVSQPAERPSSWRRVFLAPTEAAPDATGVIYISADGRNGTLIVDRLPELGSDRQYQLWLIDDGQRVSGGVFSVPADGYTSVQIASAKPLRDFGAFGITIEPAGGSPGPTGERVLENNL
ncbi:MAG: anti-sigma factor [Candidatus Promineifilaceae bacterium]|nr:anti-sigma factor [Candidatus Promineifilaceae bacterium]